ncbi:signal recognition particle-docking protein FtsY [archaeon]|nr:signal recognition particle-docking protein FtsY [archaeon]
MFGLFKKKITAAVNSITEKIASDDKVKDKNKDVIVESESIESSVVSDKNSSLDSVEQKSSKENIVVEKPAKGLISKLTGTFTEKTLSEDYLKDVLWDLELAILENNVAQDVAEKIVSDIRDNLKGRSVKRSEAEKIIHDVLKSNIFDILNKPKIDFETTIKEKNGEPLVILLIGFNGAGKTTSCAKLATYFKNKNHTCVFAAADSFRVAAIEQLEEHAQNLKVKMIKHKYGADPAAVIYDAVAHAKARHIDVVLADTAGRVHTDKNLIAELEKIVRINNPDFKFLVVEAVVGNDVVEQARVFDTVGIDGVILTKWDVDEKGGAALSVCHTLGKPIVFLGTGQEYGDFEEFDARSVVDSIF